MSASKMVYLQTADKLRELLGMNNEGQQKAILAQLRRGAGKTPGELPELLGFVLSGMPEELQGYGMSASKEEWAIYTALTLFAVHQQSKDPKAEPMHTEKNTFASAMARLCKNENEQDRVVKKFNMVSTSLDIGEMARHLRSIVQLLRSESIPFDYAQLASDLYRYQFEDGKSAVRLRWGRDFYKTLTIKNNEKNEEASENE